MGTVLWVTWLCGTSWIYYALARFFKNTMKIAGQTFNISTNLFGFLFSPSWCEETRTRESGAHRRSWMVTGARQLWAQGN